jgi:hypothetical protein
MAAIFIKSTGHDPASPDLTDLNFTVVYGQATARLSIQGMQPVPFQDRPSAYRYAIEMLAAALLETARSPQGITEDHERQV